MPTPVVDDIAACLAQRVQQLVQQRLQPRGFRVGSAGTADMWVVGINPPGNHISHYRVILKLHRRHLAVTIYSLMCDCDHRDYERDEDFLDGVLPPTNLTSQYDLADPASLPQLEQWAERALDALLDAYWRQP